MVPNSGLQEVVVIIFNCHIHHMVYNINDTMTAYKILVSSLLVVLARNYKI